jgi:preprotein translocase subunit SecA
LLENPEYSGHDEQGRTGTARRSERKSISTREKEELLFAIDEKATRPILTEKGPHVSSARRIRTPSCCRIWHAIARCGCRPGNRPRKRLEIKAKLQADFEAKAQKIHSISQLLKAYSLYQGRRIRRSGKQGHHRGPAHGPLMSGRRWSDGLHQAVEAKEGVPSSAKPRRSPPSPFRITSAFTPNWPA